MKNKIVSVGSIAIDELHTPKGSLSNIIGGSATFFSIAASRYNPVKVIGIVGNDFPQAGWDLFKKYNIDTDLITIEDGKHLAGEENIQTTTQLVIPYIPI